MITCAGNILTIVQLGPLDTRIAEGLTESPTPKPWVGQTKERDAIAAYLQKVILAVLII